MLTCWVQLLSPVTVCGCIYSLYLLGLAAGLGDGVRLLHALGLRGHDAGLSLLRGARRLRERHAHLTLSYIPGVPKRLVNFSGL